MSQTDDGTMKQLLRMQAEICQTLADPTRLEILYSLGSGEKTVGELVELTGLRQANVSQHLAMLRQRGLVNAERRGNRMCYSLTSARILDACEITREILMERLRRTGELSRELSS